MAPSETFQISVATPEDLPRVLEVQHQAFSRVASELNIEPRELLPPLRETLDDLRRQFLSGTTFFVARLASGKVIGSVRATPHGGTIEVGRLVVDSSWLRKGVASALMDRLESAYPSARAFALFTGVDAEAPLNLYLRRGYLETHREETDAVELVWLSKPGPRSPR